MTPSYGDRRRVPLPRGLDAVPAAAQDAGRWRLAARRAGNALSIGDAIIAAEAHHSGAAVLTRNVRDFALTPVKVLTC